MAESTQIRDHTLPQAASDTPARAGTSLGQRVKALVARSVFWSYERGTWQYDIIVLAILAFIFLTPRGWFQDRPTLQLTDLRHVQGLVEEGGGENGWIYLVDARLVDSFAPRKPDEAIREILQGRLGKPFTVKSIEVLRDSSRVVLGYRVTVQR
jgi:hypothetical protein